MDEEEETNSCHPDKMTTSPTHSLPNVGHFGTEFNTAVSLPGLDTMEPRVVSTTALDEAAVLPSSLGRLQSDASFDSTAMCQSLDTNGHHLTAPPLHRALSTSPRLEHTSDSQLVSDENSRHMIDQAEDGLFFPWSGSGQDLDYSSSLPAGQLHNALSLCCDRPKENGNVGISDTLLSKEIGTSVDGSRKPLVGRVRSGLRGLSRVSSHRSSLTSSVGGSQRRMFRFFSRQDSEASAGSLMSRPQGSSIFGSKMFESMSSCSLSSQHVHVAESGGVYPILASQYSTECKPEDKQDDVLTVPIANGYFDADKPFASIGVNGHVSSASCINDTEKFTIPVEAVTLQRSVSLPSRYSYHTVMTAVPDKVGVTESKAANEKLQDEEAVDNVPEMKPGAPVVTVVAGKRKWQQTMPDLVEGPESDTLTTAGSNRLKLAAAALAIIRGEYNDPGIKEAADLKDMAVEVTYDDRAERRRYIKNLLVLSLSFCFIFTSFLAIRNLQSSLNAAGGLGLYTLSSVYGFLFVGSLFTTTIVQRLGPKRSLSISMISFVVYNIANFIPRFYTLVPSAALVGFFLAVLWTSHATYVTNIAIGYATLTGARSADVLSKFHGIFFAFFQASQIAGGLISSLLLASSGDRLATDAGGTNATNHTHVNDNFYGNYSTDMDLVIANYSQVELKECGALYCPSEGTSHARNSVDASMVYLLMGIFLISTVTGMIVCILFLDPLEGIMKKTHATFRHQMTAVFRFFFDRHAVCLLGLPFYSLLQSSFMFGEFTKAFVTCSLGVHMVGYLMLSISLSSAISAYISGSIQKYVGRIALNLTAMLIHLTLLFVLFFWPSNKEQLYVFFIIAGLWGASDGILVPQIISLMGTLFQSNKEPAFAAHKMCQSLSAFALFISAPYLCTKVKIILVGCVLVVATSGYITLEVMLRLEKKHTKAETISLTVSDKKAEVDAKPIIDKNTAESVKS